jgi:hypothetical protein
MNRAMLKAFSVELQSIEKNAGFLRDVGTNIGNTLKGFTSPVQATKKGWQVGGWTQGGESKAMLQHGLPVGQLGKKWAAGKGVGRFLPGAKSMTVAGGALMLPSVLKKEDPSGKGTSRLERGARFVGNQVGGLIGAPYGLSGAIAGSLIGELGGAVVGKGIDKARGYKKPPKKVQFEPELPEPAQARLTGPQVE